MIASETGVANVIDPLGGSWYVEHMTDLMEQRAEEIFARIDRFGEGRMLEGVLAGIEQGWFQQQMADAAFRYQQQLEKGEKIVGVNKYVTEDDAPWRSCASRPRSSASSRPSWPAAGRPHQGKVDAALAHLRRGRHRRQPHPQAGRGARVEATVGEMAAALKRSGASTPSRRVLRSAVREGAVAPRCTTAVDAADAVVDDVPAIVVQPLAVLVQCSGMKRRDTGQGLTPWCRCRARAVDEQPQPLKSPTTDTLPPSSPWEDEVDLDLLAPLTGVCLITCRAPCS